MESKIRDALQQTFPAAEEHVLEYLTKFVSFEFVPCAMRYACNCGAGLGSCISLLVSFVPTRSWCGYLVAYTLAYELLAMGMLMVALLRFCSVVQEADDYSKDTLVELLQPFVEPYGLVENEADIPTAIAACKRHSACVVCSWLID
jgi:hypothetical protein